MSTKQTTQDTRATAAAPGPLTWRRATVLTLDAPGGKGSVTFYKDRPGYWYATADSANFSTSATLTDMTSASYHVRSALRDFSSQWGTHTEYHAQTPGGQDVRVISNDGERLDSTWRAELQADPPFSLGRFATAADAMEFINAAFGDSRVWRIDHADTLRSTSAEPEQLPDEPSAPVPHVVEQAVPDGWIAEHSEDGRVDGYAFARGGQILGFVSTAHEHGESGMFAAYRERGLSAGPTDERRDRCIGVYVSTDISTDDAKAAVEAYFATPGDNAEGPPTGRRVCVTCDHCGEEHIVEDADETDCPQCGQLAPLVETIVRRWLERAGAGRGKKEQV